jgi:hypothetical protein
LYREREEEEEEEEKDFGGLCWKREREKRRKFWMTVITLTNCKLIRYPLGASWP